MRTYLLPKDGNFYKANLHCHSNISDGILSPEELKTLYKSHGYAVLAYTDHDIFLPHHDLSDENFLALAGFELQYNEDGVYPSGKNHASTHFCFIAKSSDMVLHPDWNEKCAYIGNSAEHIPLVQYDKTVPTQDRNRSFACVNESIRKARDAGFFVTYNHPTWSLDNYETYTGFCGMHAMEIFNNDCFTLGYPSYVPHIYDDMLRTGKCIFALATDDNHNKFPIDNPKFDSFGGFTMIKAASLDYETITDALFAGHFYATQGPEIYDLYIEGDRIRINCSDARVITLNTNRRSAQSVFAAEGEALREASFVLDREDVYFRITVQDAAGRHANTNAYFIDSI